MPIRNRRGGLHRGTLFDTNVPATSIDKDIFTDQTVETTIADDDLVLMLDVSETPDVIKYMTRSNFTAGLAGETIQVTDNESTNENNLVSFIADAATTTGKHGHEMDGDFHYNPSTGTVTATTFAGNLTGNASGSAATLASSRTIGMTGDVVWTSASFDGSGNVTGTAAIQPDSVVLGTDSTGNYVGTVTAGTGLTSTGATSGEGISHSLSVDAAQSQITTVGTIDTGTWEGDTIAVGKGGTGATSLTDLITLTTHTTGNYVGTVTAGTGLTSTGATTGEGIAHGLSVDASQSQITTVGTIGSGTWEGTTVAVAQGGTGATTLAGIGITLATHTAGDYVQNITAGTGLTSSGATSGENIAHSLSVDASQSHITAVGTVTTGTWSTGAVIAGATMTLGSDATGDTYYRNASGVLTRLAKGSDTNVLTLASGIPSWAAPTTGDITGVDLTGGTNVNISSETGTTGGNYSSTINLDTSPTLTSSSASEPVLSLTNTHAGATAGILRFNKDSASGDDNDVMGTIEFFGTDAGEATHEKLAYIDSYVVDATAGGEQGGLRFYVAENAADLALGLSLVGQAEDGEVDVTIGAGAASVTTIAGTLTMGSTAAMTNAGLVTVANQSNITGVSTITSGTWEGTDVAVAHGGTGVSTLTDGGVLLGSDAGAITAMAVLADSEMIVGDGSTDPVAESGATLRTSIGVSIGSDVQAYDAELAAIAGLTSAANKIPMFSGSGSASLIDFKDEDAMGSDSATAVASQQSVKAYADTKASAGFSVAMSIAL
jgi:hypothetical protein